MNAEKRLVELKLELPSAPKPVAVYRTVVVAGNLAYVSGHGPLKSDGTMIYGRVGADLDLAAGKSAARQTWVGHPGVARRANGKPRPRQSPVENVRHGQCYAGFPRPPRSHQRLQRIVRRSLWPGKAHRRAQRRRHGVVPRQYRRG